DETGGCCNPIADGGPVWTPITPFAGSLFHAETHAKLAGFWASEINSAIFCFLLAWFHEQVRDANISLEPGSANANPMPDADF
ncbi:hypothetical protein, partial [Agrobacterium salinitolerans]|uniref:hypothetical protein n=1 Tax=Agrobacterium salinitolerans TaxID=1183413 RepID=UPI001AEEA0B9